MPLTAKIGTITKARPALQRSKDGRTVFTKFGIKEVKPYGADENWQPRFYNVTAFKEMAERICRDFDKGDRVLVIGQGERREYPKNDGTVGVSNDITADGFGPDVRFCGVDIHREKRSTAPPPDPEYAEDDMERPF